MGTDLSEPFIYVHDPDILSVLSISAPSKRLTCRDVQIVTSGQLASGSRQVREDPLDLTLTFRCRKLGDTLVTVALKSKLNIRMTVLFALRKKCAGV